jgi:hypothetical protein
MTGQDLRPEDRPEGAAAGAYVRLARLTRRRLTSSGYFRRERSDHQVTCELAVLRAVLAETCKRERIPITAVDLEVLELLLAGYDLAATAEAMGLSRSEVKRSRNRWRIACSLTRRDAPVGDRGAASGRRLDRR